MSSTEINFNFLDKTSVEEIFFCFQKAFSDYIIPIDASQKRNVLRWNSIGVDYSLSIGCFVENKLVGFILHAPKQKLLFNFATGVIPEYRGNHLVERMYQWGKTHFQDFDFIKLEVISTNLRAIKTYERVGLKVHRKLHCYKGQLPKIHCETQRKTKYYVKPLSFSPEMLSMMKFEYSTEQSKETIVKNNLQYELHELRDDDRLIAFAIYNPARAVFLQLESLSPVESNLNELLKFMKLEGEEIRMNNIPEENIKLNHFFEKFAQRYVSQFEMIWTLKDSSIDLLSHI